MNDFVAQIMPSLTALLAAVAIFGITHAALWLRSKTNSTWAQGVIARAEADLEAAVQQASQDAAATGGDPAKIKAQAIADFKKIWGVAGISDLVKVLGFDPTMLDAWLAAHTSLHLPAPAPQPAAAK